MEAEDDVLWVGRAKTWPLLLYRCKQSVVGWEDDRTQVRRRRGMLGFLT